MAKREQLSLPVKLIRKLFRHNNRYQTDAAIRFVYFGLRARFILLLSIVSAVIVGGLAVTFWLEQKQLLAQQNRKKARLLTKIMSTPAALYLDTVRNADNTTRQVKLDVIKREATAFAGLNPEIVRIQLTDRKGRLRFSSHFTDWKNYRIPAYIRRRLTNRRPGLSEDNLTVKKNGAQVELTVLIHPVVSHNTVLKQLPADMEKFLPLQAAGRQKRNYYDRVIRNRYRKLLPAGGVTNTNLSGHRLWLSLLRKLRYSRPIPVQRSQRWLWQDNWLNTLTQRKKAAYRNDRAAAAAKIEQIITNRLHKLAEEVRRCRLLGYLAVTFDPSAQTAGLTANLKRGLTVAAVMFLLSVAGTLFALRRVIRDIQGLERWAVSISNGSLGNQLTLPRRDELGRLGDLLNHMLADIKIKYELEKYVSNSTRSHLKKSTGKGRSVKPGATARRELVFLFSDVRGFTSFSENHDPDTVISVLNRYLELQSEIIKSLRGDINDYVGDEIMAHFSGETGADRALEAAQRIRTAIQEENERRTAAGEEIFQVGIGVHGGEVVTGNIGSKFRMDFACVGDAVNLGSRLCSAAGPGEVIISDETLQQVKGSFPLKKGRAVKAKGKAKPIKIHLLTD